MRMPDVVMGDRYCWSSTASPFSEHRRYLMFIPREIVEIESASPRRRDPDTGRRVKVLSGTLYDEQGSRRDGFQTPARNVIAPWGQMDQSFRRELEQLIGLERHRRLSQRISPALHRLGVSAILSPRDDSLSIRMFLDEEQSDAVVRALQEVEERRRGEP